METFFQHCLFNHEFLFLNLLQLNEVVCHKLAFLTEIHDVLEAISFKKASRSANSKKLYNVININLNNSYFEQRHQQKRQQVNTEMQLSNFLYQFPAILNTATENHRD